MVLTKIVAKLTLVFLLFQFISPFAHLQTYAMSTLDIVDNNVNKNVLTNLHGYCAGADFRYDVYWDDSSGAVTDVQVVIGSTAQQTINVAGFNSGLTTTSSPATYIRRNNSSLTPFTIQVRETANPSNISDPVTVTPKDCTALKIGGNQNFSSSNASAYTVPTSGVTHVRASVIGGGGNGSKKPNNNKITTGGGGGAAGITVAQVAPGDVLSVTIGAGRSGGSAGSGRAGTSSVSSAGSTIVSAQGGAGRGQGYEGFNAGGTTGTAHVLRPGGGTSNATSGAAGNLAAVGYAGALTPGGTSGGGSAGKIAGGGGGGLFSGQRNRNGGTGARGAARIETYDTEVVKPTVTIDQSSTQSDPTIINNTVKFTAVFSEPITVSSFTCEDITLSGSASSSCNSITQTGALDGTTFDIELTATTAGTVIASIPDAAVHDIVGNNNVASTSVDNIVNVLDSAPGGVGGNLGLWLKANHGIPTGSTATGWLDQSGNEYDLIDAGASPYLYIENGLNFNPTIQNPDGTNRRLARNEAISLQTVSIITIPDNPGSCDGPFGERASDDDNIRVCISGGAQWHIPGNTAGFSNGGQGWFNGVSAINPAHNNAPHILTVEAGNVTTMANGIELGDTMLNRYWHGDIAEIVGYASTHSNTDRQKVESYLALKYGITLDQTTPTNYLASDESIVWNADAVPTMISDTSPSGTAFTSNPNVPAYRVFDDLIGSNALNEFATTINAPFPRTIGYQFPAAQIINTMSLTASELLPNRSPRDFTIQGSNNGVDWNILETLVGEIGWTANEKRIYTFSNTNPYTHYRIATTLNQSDNLRTHIAEIEFISNYNHDIFGIAKDDTQALDQRISNSVNSGAILTLSTDNDFKSINTAHADILTDGQYLVIGNNGGVITTQTGELDTAIYADRLSREWRVENTNSVGTVNLSFDGFDDNYVLLTDIDGDFSSGAINKGALSASGAIALTLNDGEFFTLATTDTTGPDVTLNQAATQADPETSTGVVNFTARFSEAIDITSFTCSDISTSGTATATCTDITEVSGGNVFNVEITATTAGEVLTLIQAGVVTDLAGNGNTLSNSIDNSVTIVSGVFNSTPTDITLSGSGNIDENSAIGSTIGNLTTTDLDLGDTHTYTFATGSGDTDNSSFTLSGSELLSTTRFDYETQTGATIRLQTDDGNGGTYQEIFTIDINDLDEVAPVITITGDTTVNHLVNSFYIDANATCTDDVDTTCSVTASGIVDGFTLGTYYIDYNATDAAGNTAITQTRTISVVSGDTPIITLNGSGTIILETGDSYTDAGAEYSDTEDGTGSLLAAGGPVTTTGTGAFTLTYDFTDSQGNVATQVTRTVNVLDTIAPTSSGALSAPTPSTPTNNTGATLAGACGIDAANGRVIVTTTAENGFNNQYATGITLSSTGSFEILNPDWNEGTYTINLDCYDAIGNGPTPTIGLGPVIIDITAPTDPTVVSLSPSPAQTGTPITLSLSNVEPGTTVTVPGMVCAPTPTPANGLVDCTATATGGLLDGTNNTITVTDPVGNTNSNVSSPILVIDDTAPVPSVPTTAITSTGVTITWTTDEPSSSEIVYGLTSVVDQTTGELNVSPKVTNHSLSLTDLEACTTYYYQTISTDASGNVATDGIYNFTTLGCPGNASIIDQDSTDIIPTGSGATGANTLSLGLGENLVDVEVPVGYFDTGSGSCAGNGVYFQFKQLQEASVVSELGTPLTDALTLRVYELSAYCDVDEQIEEFDKDLNVTMTYSESDIANINEETLRIYRFDEVQNQWNVLDNCNLNTDTNTVTCKTDHFSTFGIFGVNGFFSTSGGGTGTKYCRDPKAENYREAGEADNRKCIYKESSLEPEPKPQEETPIEPIENEEEEIVEIPVETLTEPETETNSEMEKGTDYTLENDFDSCSIIRDINDENYTYTPSGVFTDEATSIHQNTILKFAEIGIVDGYDDNTFKPFQEMTRTEFLKVALISHCYTYRELDGTTDYTDMTDGTWQARVIEKAESLGMINGDISETGAKIFRPNDIITKAEAVKILMRLSLIQATDPEALGYIDITVDWHEKYIQTGQTLGLFTPAETNNRFNPDGGVSREDMVDLISNLVDLYQ